MRIAIFSDTYLPQVNGVVNVVHQSANALAEAGHDVMVVTVSGKPSIELQKIINKRIQLIVLPSLPFWGYAGERIALPFGSGLYKLWKFKPQLIHAHTPFTVGWCAVILARTLGIPLVGTHHTFYDYYLKHVKMDFTLMKKFTWKYTVFYYNRCNLVLSPSESLAESLVKNGLKANLQRLPNSVDTERFKPSDNGKKKELKEFFGLSGKSMLYFGRLSYEKSLDQVLAAFKEVAKNDSSLSFMMVGEGPERIALEKISKEMHLGNRLVFTGLLKGKKLVEAINANDVFVMASKSENMSLVVLEALACGLPVVAASAGGIPEIVKDDINGFLVLPDHPQDIAAKSLQLINDQEMYNRLSEAARQTAMDFSENTIIKNLIAYYQLLLINNYESVPLFRISKFFRRRIVR